VNPLIQVDTASPVPAYEQLRAQVETMVGSGVLTPGTPMPTIRQLAADLGLAANTVARAYRELELGGVVVSRVRHGTVIADTAVVHRPAAQTQHRLSEAAAIYALTCRQLGVTAEEALAAVSLHLT
jgi:DNA-binding transcriptional regulator YhcF (GntR family)